MPLRLIGTWCIVLMMSGLGLAVPEPTAIHDTTEAVSCSFGEPLVGLTAPRRRVALAAVQEGRIESIPVDEGDFVRAGQVVFSLDDAVQRANVDIAAARAESTLEIDLARARWERAERDRDWRLKLHGDERASSKELNDARSDAEVLGLEYRLAVFGSAQAARTLELQRRLLEQYHVRAPFDGYVVDIARKAGETVDRFEVVLTLAQLDPLEVALDCPIPLAACFHAGDRLTVRPVDGASPARTGIVALASLVGDGASQTFKLKLLVDNADRAWVAGIKVAVDLPSLERAALPVSGGPAARASSAE